MTHEEAEPGAGRDRRVDAIWERVDKANHLAGHRGYPHARKLTESPEFIMDVSAPKGNLLLRIALQR